MTGRIFLKLLAAVACVLAIALYATEYLVSHVTESGYTEILRRNLEDKARILVGSGNIAHVDKLAAIAHARITLVARDGRVLADSSADSNKMENPGDRPELRDAFSGNAGFSIRLSPSLHEKYLYVAVPTDSGALRLSVPLASISAELSAIRWKMLQSTAGVFVVALIVALIVAGLFARRLSQRFGDILNHSRELANGNFQARPET